jgi:protein-disulfide isomerase
MPYLSSRPTNYTGKNASRIFARVLCLIAGILVTRSPLIAQSSDSIVASGNEVTITLKDVDKAIVTQVDPLLRQLYALRRAALENLITSRILENEARKRKTSVESLRQQLMTGEISVTNSQVETAYLQNAAFFGAMSPDEAKERLRLDLENQVRMKYYRTGLESLKKNANVRILLDQPDVLTLDDGISPRRGAPNPVVTIVEFSDFECPYCRSVQPTLTQLLQTYGDQLRLVYKHLPLEGHKNSLAAARRAYCASEQDRFWQYHDAVFASKSLSPEALDQIAADLGLGLEKFQKCLASDASQSAVVKDIEAARLMRVNSTPSFIVNGKLLSGALSFAEFQNAIDRELSKLNTSKPSSTK